MALKNNLFLLCALLLLGASIQGAYALEASGQGEITNVHIENINEQSTSEVLANYRHILKWQSSGIEKVDVTLLDENGEMVIDVPANVKKTDWMEEWGDWGVGIENKGEMDFVLFEPDDSIILPKKYFLEVRNSDNPNIAKRVEFTLKTLTTPDPAPSTEKLISDVRFENVAGTRINELFNGFGYLLKWESSGIQKVDVTLIDKSSGEMTLNVPAYVNNNGDKMEWGDLIVNGENKNEISVLFFKPADDDDFKERKYLIEVREADNPNIAKRVEFTLKKNHVTITHSPGTISGEPVGPMRAIGAASSASLNEESQKAFANAESSLEANAAPISEANAASNSNVATNEDASNMAVIENSASSVESKDIAVHSSKKRKSSSRAGVIILRSSASAKESLAANSSVLFKDKEVIVLSAKSKGEKCDNFVCEIADFIRLNFL